MNFLRSGILSSASSSSAGRGNRAPAAPSIQQLAARERQRAASLREGCASHPLANWDTEHVCEWLALNGLAKFSDAARRNGLTGRLLMRLHRASCWDDPEDGLGKMDDDELARCVGAFRRREAQVIVRVYDVTGGLGSKGKTALMLVNKMFRSSLGGAYHCGIEVYGLEWAFGDAGIYCTSPRHEVMGHHFREVCILPVDSPDASNASGAAVADRCRLRPREVRKLADSLKPMWPGSRYDLIHCNCCHFADAFARALGVGGIPSWINRAARIGAGADVAYLTSGVPTLPRHMRGTKEDEQARAMIESANRLLQEGLITRDEYRDLREKHRRFVDEAAGPCERARLQSHSTVALSEATKQAKALLDAGTITKSEYDTILSAHDGARRRWSTGGAGPGARGEMGGSVAKNKEKKKKKTPRLPGGSRGRATSVALHRTKAERLLGVGEDKGGGNSMSVGKPNRGEDDAILELEL